MDITDQDFLMHIGVIRRSGRYPWGSGSDPQGYRDFKASVDEMKKQGLSESQIAEGLGIKTPELRAGIAISTEQIRGENVAMATRLSKKGMSNAAIAERMGLARSAESTVRGWLKNAETIDEKSILATTNVLKEHVAKKPFLDVGKGTHLYMGITESKLLTAIAAARFEGYVLHTGIQVPQLGTDKFTEFKILTKKGVTWAEARAAAFEGRVLNITDHSDDGGLTYKRPELNPVSINSKRLEVRYKEQGGDKMDGVIELRRGVSDLSLGESRYAQVRVAVDGTHYLKGMAMYADDLPVGVDIRFNTNKKQSDAPGLEALKPLKTNKETGELDKANPFGATVHPKVYTDKSGKEKTSPLNIVNEEGDWDKWSKSLSSQMLSKQSYNLARSQLAVTQKNKQQELDDIMSLTNPVVKHKLLTQYAEDADAAAEHLKAAAMPRQSSHVILPMNSMRPNEIYAPNFNNGERVALVRYPHGGPFEIPELTVNNKNLTARRILSNAKDAVGIHHSVADQLSGADFDGDSVLVIPNPDKKIKARPPLEGLKGFDAKAEYPKYDGMKVMAKADTQREMGKISNLITDMTIQKAPDSDLARAVKHSMVVIDAEKHELNYKQSEYDNGILQLKKKYQKGPGMGASTIISRASADASVPKQRLQRASEGGSIDPKTGELIFVKTGESYLKPVTKTNPRTGETTTTYVRTEKITKGSKMEFAKDAHSLKSTPEGEPMENLYADHANSMKRLANEARKSSLVVREQFPKQSPAAKAVYAKEVESLDRKLKNAQMNAPLERRAQIIGGATYRQRVHDNPHLEKDDLKKIRFQSLEDARIQTGASKQRIGSDDVPLLAREWEAIQAGAVSHSKLSEILNNSDMDRVRELATPRSRSSLTPGQMAVARQLAQIGRPMSEIADRLGIPRSTIAENLARG